MFRAFCVTLAVGSVLAAVQVEAQEETTGAPSRTWTSQNVKYTTEAAFTGFRTGKVQLKRSDGKSIEVPLVELSDEDQAYVRRVAVDDPAAVAGLEKQKVELERNQQGRTVEARFPPNRRVDASGIRLLSGLPNLERLRLAQVRPAEGTFNEIANLPNLRQLDLTGTPVGNSEVRHLVDLSRLKALSLSDTRITNRALSYVKELPQLAELALANTRIGDDGIANLEEMSQLKELNLGNTRISPQGVLRLRKALPNTSMQGSGVVIRRR